MTIVDSITQTIRRRYILGKQGLWPGRRWMDKNGTAMALRAVEAVQIDPVSVITPSADIVLWGRVSDYQPAYLHTLMYEERQFFDYGGGLMIYPIEELPYWRVMMERAKSEKRWADFAEANPTLIDEVRQELRDRGPLRNRDIVGKSVNHYRASKDTGVALYYLWLTGELMSHSRQGKERVYDFLENVAPAEWQYTEREDEATQFFTRKAISELGLVSERDFRRILKSVHNRAITAPEVASRLAEMVEAGQVDSVRFENYRKPLYFLATDKPLLESLANGLTPAKWHPLNATNTEEVIFLSPLEYVSARGRAKDLFDFDYIWEIYKPASKRKYGPYTLPILYGDRLVARMDAKLERQSQTLLINGFWLEAWFEPDDTFAMALAKGLLNFAKFLGAERMNTPILTPKFLRVAVEAYLRSNDVVTV